MKKKSTLFLGIYDLLLATAAIYTGFLMVDSNTGIFNNYPSEWLSELPFKNWSISGLIVLFIFGAGNLTAAFFSLKGRRNRSWLVSAIVGGAMLIAVVLQVLLLNQWYLASVEILVLSTIQLTLSAFALYSKETHE